jgi:N-acetylglucosamine-6-phosphate deacetylase
MTEPTDLWLRNARLVLDQQLIERGALLVKSGRIENILVDDGNLAIPNAVAFDLEGGTLFPGFIDVHIHGAVGVDTLAASAADLNRVSDFLAGQGVTAWLPTLVPAADAVYKQAVDSISAVMNEQQPSAARVLGVHYEGPFVSQAQCGALHVEHFRAYSGAADLAGLPTPDAANAVRMMTVAPEVSGGIELVRELTRQGWVVSLGHTRAAMELLDQAFAAGAHHMTHFMNAMSPLHHRSPGPVGWGLSRDDVTCDIIADGVHLDPQMLRLLLKLKSPSRLTLISDAIAAAGLGDGDYQIWGETISVREGRTQNARGSIAGAVITMADAVRLMLQLGVAETEVARMASTNPARLLGLETECGSIAKGKRADLVALDKQGKVQLTIVGGVLSKQI